MTYNDLVALYFQRAGALQWYWTLYVVVIGGLLAFSSLRQRPDTRSVLLIIVLYACFAFKNMGAIVETSGQRDVILGAIRDVHGDGGPAALVEARLVPTLVAQTPQSIRRFHVACDLLTVLTLLAMERRRVRWAKSGVPVANP